MSVEKCSGLCRDSTQFEGAATTYFGIAFGRDCWCGNDVPTASVPAETCDFTNSGANDQVGGGRFLFSIFTRGDLGPGSTDDFDGAAYQGCWATTNADGTPVFNSELAPFTPTEAPFISQASCKAYCVDYKFFAITGGNTCQCDNSYEYGSVDNNEIVLTPADCSTRARGARTEAGGADNAYTVYQNLDYQVRPKSLTLCSKLCSANCIFDPG